MGAARYLHNELVFLNKVMLSLQGYSRLIIKMAYIVTGSAEVPTYKFHNDEFTKI